MVAMEKEGMTAIVSHDHHFEQEGFTALLRQGS
jgi:predicted nucleic acid-binding protein